MERFHMYNLSAIMADLFNDLLAVSPCGGWVQLPNDVTQKVEKTLNNTIPDLSNGTLKISSCLCCLVQFGPVVGSFSGGEIFLAIERSVTSRYHGSKIFRSQQKGA